MDDSNYGSCKRIVNGEVGQKNKYLQQLVEWSRKRSIGIFCDDQISKGLFCDVEEVVVLNQLSRIEIVIFGGEGGESCVSRAV